MKEGDSNNKCFHDSVKSNRLRNGLEKLLNANGIIQRSKISKGEVAVSYFKDLFK